MDTNAELSDANYNDALNDFNHLVNSQPRTLSASAMEDGDTQTVQTGQVFFASPYDDVVVPAYTPHIVEKKTSSLCLADLGPTQFCVVEFYRADGVISMKDFFEIDDPFLCVFPPLDFRFRDTGIASSCQDQ